MSDEPMLLKLDVHVKKHTQSEEADKEALYGIILKNKKGDAIKVTLKLETVDPNLQDRFALQEKIQIVLTNPQTKVDSFNETSEEATKEEESTEQPAEETKEP